MTGEFLRVDSEVNVVGDDGHDKGFFHNGTSPTEMLSTVPQSVVAEVPETQPTAGNEDADLAELVDILPALANALAGVEER